MPSHLQTTIEIGGFSLRSCFMDIEELIQYHACARKKAFIQGKRMTGISFRKKLHPLVLTILKVDQILSKEKIVIISDKHLTDSTHPRIYACTHIGGNDIQRTFQVIKEPAYLMLGDPGILYKMPIYQGLRMNGVIPLETADRDDRKIAYSRAVELLERGGNLLIYPEGAWNVTANLVVMKIFNGTVRMAQETGAEIIPIGVEQYGDTFYFNIGENYMIPRDSAKSISELRDDLRDKLATLKWEVMETQPLFDRSRLTENYLQIFQEEIVGKCNYGYGFSLEDAIRERYHDKTVTEPEEAFAFLSNLNPSKDNAFLLRDFPISAQHNQYL